MAAKENSDRSALQIGRIALILAAIIAAIAIAVAIFRSTGSGDSSAKDTAATTAAPSPEAAIAELEAKLKKNPDDVEGWQMLGWAFFETGRYAEAATAYRKAVALSPNNAEFSSALGEALVLASDGSSVPVDALTAFEKALAVDPKDPRARYFIGVHKDLSGKTKDALEDWFALLKDTPAGAPWEADLRRTIEQVGARDKIDVSARLAAATPAAPMAPAAGSVATAAIPGPSRDDMAAAAKLPPSEQQQMVRGMVDGLAERLARNPKDADGWIRLMRSRMVLGERDQARAALTSARAAFTGDSAQLARFDQAARELGL